MSSPSINSEREFLKLWAAEAISCLGSGILSFALMLWVYEQTKDPSVLGYLMFAYFGPQIYFSLFGGHLVDFFSKQRLLIFSDAVQALGSVAILLFVHFEVFGFLPLVFINLVCGFFAGVQSLIFLSSTRSFVRPQRLIKFNGLMQVLQATPIVVSPLLAWPLLQSFGIQGLATYDLFTFGLKILIVTKIKFPPTIKASKPKRSWGDVFFCVRQIWANIN